MSKRLPILKQIHSLAAALLLLSAICLSQQAAPTATPPTQAPAPSEGPAPLRVMVGKSLLINTTDRLKRVSVTDPEIADALVVTATQVLVHGRSPGEVSLLIWDEFERSRSFDLRVDVDITAAAEEMKRIFPDEQIDVSASRSAIVLSGHVTTEDVEKHAGMVAAAYSKNVMLADPEEFASSCGSNPIVPPVGPPTRIIAKSGALSISTTKPSFAP